MMSGVERRVRALEGRHISNSEEAAAQRRRALAERIFDLHEAYRSGEESLAPVPTLGEIAESENNLNWLEINWRRSHGGGLVEDEREFLQDARQNLRTTTDGYSNNDQRSIKDEHQ
jgi:hypothetical protein